MGKKWNEDMKKIAQILNIIIYESVFNDMESIYASFTMRLQKIFSRMLTLEIMNEDVSVNNEGVFMSFYVWLNMNDLSFFEKKTDKSIRSLLNSLPFFNITFLIMTICTDPKLRSERRNLKKRVRKRKKFVREKKNMTELPTVKDIEACLFKKMNKRFRSSFTCFKLHTLLYYILFVIDKNDKEYGFWSELICKYSSDFHSLCILYETFYFLLYTAISFKHLYYRMIKYDEHIKIFQNNLDNMLANIEKNQSMIFNKIQKKLKTEENIVLFLLHSVGTLFMDRVNLPQREHINLAICIKAFYEFFKECSTYVDVYKLLKNKQKTLFSRNKNVICLFFWNMKLHMIRIFIETIKMEFSEALDILKLSIQYERNSLFHAKLASVKFPLREIQKIMKKGWYMITLINTKKKYVSTAKTAMDIILEIYGQFKKMEDLFKSDADNEISSIISMYMQNMQRYNELLEINFGDTEHSEDETDVECVQHKS